MTFRTKKTKKFKRGESQRGRHKSPDRLPSSFRFWWRAKKTRNETLSHTVNVARGDPGDRARVAILEDPVMMQNQPSDKSTGGGGRGVLVSPVLFWCHAVRGAYLVLPKTRAVRWKADRGAGSSQKTGALLVASCLLNGGQGVEGKTVALFAAP